MSLKIFLFIFENYCFELAFFLFFFCFYWFGAKIIGLSLAAKVENRLNNEIQNLICERDEEENKRKKRTEKIKRIKRMERIEK